MLRLSIRLPGVFTMIFLFAHFAAAASYLSEGHVDLQLGGGDLLGLSLYCRGGSSGTVVNGANLTSNLYLDPLDAITAIPESTKSYAQSQGGATSSIASALGVNVGDNYWFMPQSSLGAGSASSLHAPYYGIGAESMNTGVFDNDAVDFTLLDMTGPAGGQFALQQSGVWLIETVDGITGDDKVAGFPIPGHDHYKWFFSRPGVYQLTMQSSAVRTNTGVPETSVSTFTFLVGTEIWKGTTSNDWSDVSNWKEGTAPGYGSTVIFTTAAVPNQPLSQNIAAPLDLHGLVFTVNAGSFQLGGQTLRFSVDSPAVSSDSPNDQIIGNPLDLAEDTAFAVNGTGNITLAGTVGGSGAFIKTGSGTLILANEAAHSGNTLIAEGALR